MSISFIKTGSNANIVHNELDVNLIIDRLWLGNSFVTNDLEFMLKNKIDVVINVTDDVPNHFLFLSYYNFPFKDRYICGSNDKKYKISCNILNYGAELINSLIKLRYNVLIHCKRGHHRSASIVAYYLVKYCNYSLDQAISIIKSKRPNALRRLTCMFSTLIKIKK